MNKITINTFLKISGLFVISRLMVAIAILFSSHQFASSSVRGAAFQYCSNSFLNCLGCWDSGWYLNVAKNGYTFLSSCQDQTAFGFFPLYPMAMKLLAAAIGDQFIAGIIISNVLLFIASLFLFSLSDRIYQNKKTAMLSVLILYFFPGSYLLSGVFSESAFICFSVMCIYYFETDDYALCGISGFLLSLTRPFGILILLPLCLRYIQRNGLRFRLRSLFLLLIPMGILSFFAYCYFITGDFLFYVHAKQQGWNNNYVSPWISLVKALHIEDPFIRFNSFYLLFWLLMMVLMIRHVPLYLLIWVLLLVITPLSNGWETILCMPRYLIPCFPLFMMLAAYIVKHRRGWVLILLLASINMIMTGFFALGYMFTA